MSFYLVAEKGDSLPGLAYEYGFCDYHTIWDRAENQALRDKRKNPNVLFAGDRVFIPDKQPRTETCATGATHRFTLKGQPTHLRLELLDFAGSPLRQASIALTLDGKTATVTTDGEGVLDRVVPPGAEWASLEAKSMGKLEVRIGHLDPVDERAGMLARLSNLGYVAGTDELDVDADDLRFAIELFQRDNGLRVDGEVGAELLRKLEEVHGC